MIHNDEQLLQARQALVELEGAMAALSRQREKVHPARYALMAEPILYQMGQLRSAIETYVGAAAAQEAAIPVWIRLQGPSLEYPDAPASVVTAIVELFRVGVQAVTEYLCRGVSGQRPTSEIKEACDFRIHAFAPGSVRVGLSLPYAPQELFPEVSLESKVKEALKGYLETAAWAASDEDNDVLESTITDADLRRVILLQVGRLVPRPRGKLESVELSGNLVPRPTVRMTRSARDRVRSAVQRTLQPTFEFIEARGVLREIDLDSRTFDLRDPEQNLETRCRIPDNADDLYEIAKESLDYAIVVRGTRKIGSKRSIQPLEVVEIDVEGRDES